MNMILDTMLSGPEAMLIAICLGFIFGMFWHAGNRMNEEDTYNADYWWYCNFLSHSIPLKLSIESSSSMKSSSDNSLSSK
jgi:hypothetical protein